MPTIAGIRRRGYTPEAIRDFCARIGVAKKENVIDVALLEHTVREDLNRRAQRALAVLRPLKVVIENYPEDRVEHVQAVNNPEDPAAGTRQRAVLARALHRARRLHGEPAEEVLPAVARHRGAPALRLHPQVRAGRQGRRRRDRRAALHDRSRVADGATAARRVKGTIHWVSAAHALDAEVRLYDRLFTLGGSRRRTAAIRSPTSIPHSLEVLTRLQGRAVAGRPRRRVRASSSSARATSASTPTRAPAHRSSTARSR